LGEPRRDVSDNEVLETFKVLFNEKEVASGDDHICGDGNSIPRSSDTVDTYF